MRKACLTRKAEQDRDSRKEARQEREKQQQWERLVAELQNRMVKFEERNALEDERKLKPRLAPLEDFMVSCDENGVLSWPVVFCYPEFHTTDFQQQLSETTKMHEALEQLFAEPLEYDKAGVYRASKVNVYYENRILGFAYMVDKNKTIREIVAERSFVVFQGTLTFYLVVKGSKQEESFVNQTRIPLKTNY
uniref:Cns1/TTC4 wheel domain-containing protein n=1 Tax=Anopheles funestus TaxID=62324 RepID=A0A182RSS4_ANOFN